MGRNWIGAAFLAGALGMAPVASTQAQGPGQDKGYGPGAGMGPGPGMGPGQGMGPGPGMGPGQGMGPGAGPGRMHQRWARERMFGTPLMSLEERQAYMTKMWNARSPEERDRIRSEHRDLMLERARQRQQSIDEQQDDRFSVPEIR